jgi:Heterokaryon incompatibility protein (HET)
MTMKRQKVRDMHNIFKTAAGVFVWLGGADETSTVAMDTISRMRKVMKTLPARSRDYRGGLAQFGLSPPDESVWSAISNLYNRSWMQRLWVIQEVVLARRLRIFCGLSAMEWDTFAQFCVNLEIFDTVVR